MHVYALKPNHKCVTSDQYYKQEDNKKYNCTQVK